MEKPKRIALIIPSFSAGGAERVMATLANHFQKQSHWQVHLIILTGGERYYELDENIKIHQPDFNYSRFNRLVFTVKILAFLRQTLQQIQPNAALSFGGKYNAFALLAATGLNIKMFISERSRPGISYGRFLDWINPMVYKHATGIIAQTQKAKTYLFSKTKHKNIAVIGNPIKEFSITVPEKKHVILNVGRFIASKNQDWLIDYFNAIDTNDWELWFAGEGPLMEKVMAKANESPKKDFIKFFGNQKNIEDYYASSAIFAFTSTSEGFPNALGEAQRLACACISFDCDAGPSDLITDGTNGVLVPNGAHEIYKHKLGELIANAVLRTKFSKNAMESSKEFNEEKIALDFISFIDENSN